MHVNQAQQLIKGKENKVSEESRSKDDHQCKKMKTNATLGKGNL